MHLKIMDELSKFYVLTQPLLSLLINIPDEESLNKLLSVLKIASSTTVAIGEKQLIPILVSTLQRSTVNSNCKPLSLECITTVIQKTKVRCIKKYLALYNVICSQILTKQCIIEQNASEELIYHVFSGLKELILNADDRTLNELYEECNTNIVSQGVFMAILVAKSDKRLKNRCQALEYILTVAQHSSSNVEIAEKATAILTNFIPGLVAPLSDIICKEHSANHKLTELAITCWGHVMFVALVDIEEETVKATDDDIIRSWMTPTNVMNEVNVMDALKHKIRNKDWLEAASKLLTPLIEKVSKLHRHPHPKVRRKLMSVLQKLTICCRKSLGEGVLPALDALVCLNQDPEIDKIRYLTKEQKETLTKVAQARLPVLITRLNRSLTDNAELDTTLLLLTGYLQLLKGSETVPIIFTSPLHMRNMISALVAASCLKLNSSLQQTSVADSDTSIMEVSFTNWKQFRYMEPSTVTHFLNLCQLLGSWSSQIWLDQLMHPREPAELLLLQEMISGWPAVSHEIIAAVMDVYLSFLGSDEHLNANLAESQNKVLMITLSLEGLGSLASATGTNFEKHLLTCLFSVLAHEENPFLVVQLAATKALEKISKACQRSSVIDLVQSNIDYVVHQASRRLRWSDDTLALSALRVTVGCCPTDVIECFQDIVQQALVRSSRKDASTILSNYLQLFLAFVECTSANCDVPKIENQQNSCYSFPEELKSLVTELENDLMRQKEESEDLGEEGEMDQGSVQEGPKEEVLPPHVGLTVSVIKRCLHLLATRNDREKSIALDIVCKGIKVLHPWENTLLPIVHEVWSPLVAGIHLDTKPVIMRRSFQLLCMLAAVAKDFIRSRTLKEIMPAIRKFLLKAADTKIHSATPTTQIFKLQNEMLCALGTLAVNLQLKENEIDKIMDAAIPYLSQRQHRILQESSVKLFSTLYQWDPYIIVYRLREIMDDKLFSNNVRRILPPKQENGILII